MFEVFVSKGMVDYQNCDFTQKLDSCIHMMSHTSTCPVCTESVAPKTTWESNSPKNHWVDECKSSLFDESLLLWATCLRPEQIFHEASWAAYDQWSIVMICQLHCGDYNHLKKAHCCWMTRIQCCLLTSTNHNQPFSSITNHDQSLPMISNNCQPVSVIINNCQPVVFQYKPW